MVCNCAQLAIKQAAVPLVAPRNPNDWERLVLDYEARFEQLTRDYSKDGNILRWLNGFRESVEKMHLEAHLIGQDLNGFRVLGHARAYAAEMADLESYYFSDFARAIQTGEYLDDGEVDFRKVMNRARLYLNKSRGTANVGFVTSSPIGSAFQWVLGGTEEHCPDCPVLASGGPYTEATLYTTPGAGDTPCLGNCKCHIVRVADDMAGIMPFAA